MINYGKFAVALFGKTWSYGQCGHLSALPCALVSARFLMNTLMISSLFV